METKIPYGAYILTGTIVNDHGSWTEVLINSATLAGQDAPDFHLIGDTRSFSL